MNSTSQRRRSYSIAVEQPCDNYWRGNLKRGYSRQSGYWSRDAASPPRWEVDGRRAEKRRRRDDHSPVHRSSSPFSQVGNDVSPPNASSVSSFACTPAEFHLFPRHKREARRRSSSTFDTVDTDMDEPRDLDAANLSSLRSYAFWELHTSIAESGEGFVQKMRDYEYSRSRSSAYQKAKEAQKRGRKRLGIAGCRKRATPSLQPPAIEDDDSDDDILVLAADFSPRSYARSPRHKKRHLSSDGAGGDRELDGHSSPFSTSASRPLSFYSDDGFLQDPPKSTSSDAGQSWFSSSPPLISDDAMSGVSLESEAITSFSPCPSPPAIGSPAQSSHSEKAIAALSLAMANGAVGLNDYQALLAIQETPVIDACQVGEMFD